MIHKYQLNHQNIVIDVNSGSIHIVTDAAYNIMDYYEEKSETEIIALLAPRFSETELKEACAEITELKKNGLLYSKDISGEIINQAAVRNPVIKALCLLVAHDCNLKCAYCFAEEGEYHSHGSRSLMTVETGKEAIDFLIKNSGSRQNLEIDFFGGEPLMNFDVVKQIVEYAKKQEKPHNKTFRFTITTNGVLLNDENLSYINEHMHNLVLSIDGRREINDKMRKTKDGEKSVYDLIMPKLKKAAESRVRNGKAYYVRGTFTKHNTDFTNDIIHLSEQGFKNISVEPVVGNPSTDYALTDSDADKIFIEYENLANKIIKRQNTDKYFNFFHYNIDLTGGPCAAKRLYGCGAGTEYLAVAFNGDLYPCHQFTGIKEYKMGTIYEPNTEQLRTSFEKCTVNTKDDCKACFAKYYCGGGCAANAYISNGDIYKPYALGCKLQRKRTECAIMIQAAQL